MLTDSQRKKILEEKIADFNPSESGELYHGIFGLPFTTEESKIILVPVPWEATVSYGEGASLGPKSILDASQQIDLYDPIYPDGWKRGIAMQDIPANIFYKSKQVREKALNYMGIEGGTKIAEIARLKAEIQELDKYETEAKLHFPP